MATNITHAKWEQVAEEEEDEEEVEALSLSDLPLNLIDQEDQPRKPDSHITEAQEEFDFRSWGGPASKEPEMCAADEVFFQGQILPLCLSSKTTGSQRYGQQFNRCESRSESLDHCSLSEFQSNSSRSSSIRSQNSSSSTNSTTTTTRKISKARVQNQFHPSPKRQLKVTVPRQASSGNQGRKSSAWEFFRLGVVPAPEIGLQDIKVRSTNNANKKSVSRNSSSNSSSEGNFNSNNSTTKGVNMSNNFNHNGKSKNILKQFANKGGGLFSGCKCSIETVQSDTVMIRSHTKSSNKTESTAHAMKEKVPELKRQKQRIKQGKKAVPRHRTFEWIKELLHANYPDEEALLSNS